MGPQQFGGKNLRYLVFFEIREKNEKDNKDRNVKILQHVSLLAACGTARKMVRESSPPCVFHIRQNIAKMKKKK